MVFGGKLHLDAASMFYYYWVDCAALIIWINLDDLGVISFCFETHG